MEILISVLRFFEHNIKAKNNLYMLFNYPIYVIGTTNIRQLLKIPRPLKYYHVTKELLRALTFFLESFYLFFNRIARYALQRRTSVRL